MTEAHLDSPLGSVILQVMHLVAAVLKLAGTAFRPGPFLNRFRLGVFTKASSSASSKPSSRLIQSDTPTGDILSLFGILLQLCRYFDVFKANGGL